MGFGNSSNGQHSWTISFEESRMIIKDALDQGINFFDTAMGYQNGTSEEYVGKILKEFAQRQDVVIATKIVPRSMRPENMEIATAEYVEKCVNNSLRRLGVDYIDLYILHWWDNTVPIIEYLESFNNLIQQGKIKYIGISNCYAWQLAKANAIAEAHGWAKFISIQGHYNLIFREEEREMIPLCKFDNISYTPYSPLASGRLAKHPGELSKRMNEDSYAMKKYDSTNDVDIRIIERVIELADKRGVSMTEISLAWLIAKGATPIVGATKKQHIDGAVKSVAVKLTEEEINYLEELYVPHKLVGVMADNQKKTSILNTIKA